MNDTVPQIAESVLPGGNTPIRQVHIRTWAAGTGMDFHSHAFYHVNFIAYGAVQIGAGGQVLRARAGETFVLPPDVPHRLHTDGGYVQVGVDVRPAFDDGLFALLREAYGKTPAVADMNRLRAEFGRFLCPMAAQTQLDRRMLRNLAERMVLEVIACRRAAVSEFRRAVIAQMTAEEAPRSVQELADRLFCSKSQLERRMRREFGCSAGAYLAAERLSQVCARLEAGETLRQIAEETGFCDAAHLSVFFQRHTGQSPGAYRAKRSGGG